MKRRDKENNSKVLNRSSIKKWKGSNTSIRSKQSDWKPQKFQAAAASKKESKLQSKFKAVQDKQQSLRQKKIEQMYHELSWMEEKTK